MRNKTEEKRLEKIREYLALNVALKNELQEITNLASSICNKPVSVITLPDEITNQIVAATGEELISSLHDTPFCEHMRESNEFLIIRDAKKDPLFLNSGATGPKPVIRFYAGIPLITKDGFKIGSLCLFDRKPSNLNDVQKRTLLALAKQVVFLFEAELSKMRLKEQLTEIEKKNEALRAIAQLQSHDIRQPLTSVMGLINLAQDNTLNMDDEWLSMLHDTVRIVDSRIHAIVAESLGNKDIKLLKFNKMVEEIEDYAILLLDRNGVIENWNKGAEKIKGYKTSEIVGRSFDVFYTEAQKDAGIPYKLLQEARASGVARDEGVRVKSDGTTFMARITITAIHNDKEEVIGFTKVTRDISKEHQLTQAEIRA